MEEMCSRTEAHSVNKQADGEHHVQYESGFRLKGDIRASESPGPYSFAYAEVLLQLCWGEGYHFVGKQPLLVWRADFDFSTFCEVFKAREHFSKIVSRQSDGDGMNAAFVQNVTDVETVRGYKQPVLYKKDVV